MQARQSSYHADHDHPVWIRVRELHKRFRCANTELADVRHEAFMKHGI
jgi:hypothetical protein